MRGGLTTDIAKRLNPVGAKTPKQIKNGSEIIVKQDQHQCNLQKIGYNSEPNHDEKQQQK